MGKVFYEKSMSLDGYVTGPNIRPKTALGEGVERLHDWAFNSVDPHNREIAKASTKLGAVIAGRTTYNNSIPYWGANWPTPPGRVCSSYKHPARMSKIGNPHLRKALYFPAVNTKRFNPVIQTFCEHLSQRDKHTMTNIGATMRKLGK